MFERIVFYIHLLCTYFRSRFFHWNLSLYAMLFTLIVVLPFYIAYFTVINVTFGRMATDWLSIISNSI